MVSILGLDPGLAHCGCARLECDAGTWRLASASAVVTVPADAKHRLHALDDNAERIRRLVRELDESLRTARPCAVAVEGYSPPLRASSALKLGFAWGAVAAVLEVHGLPVVQLAPQAVKAALGIQSPGRPRAGRTQNELETERKARKQAVGWRLAELLPGSRELLMALPAGAVEHATDAAAVAYAATSTDLVRALVGRAA